MITTMVLFRYSTILLVLLCSCVPIILGKVDNKRGVQEEKGVLENFVVDGDLGHWERRRVYHSSFSSSSSSSSSFSENEELLIKRAKDNNNIFLKSPPPLPKYPKCPTTKKGLLVLDKYFTYSSGLKACCEMNLYPAGITSLNFVEASDVAFSCSGPGTGTWMRSWNRDNYGGDTCLSFNTAWTKGGGSINPAASCEEGKKVMCQVMPAPEEPFFCSQFTTTTTTTTSRSTSCTSTSTSSSTSTSTTTDTSTSTSTNTSTNTSTDTSISTSISTSTDTSISDTSTSSTSSSSSSSSSSNQFISTHVMTATQFTTLTVTSTSTTSTITTGTAYTTQTISPINK